MTATLVETKKTTYTPAQIIKGLVEGWQKLFGTLPSKKQIAVIWAQNSLETGGTTSMYCNNIGNAKYVANASDGPEIKYCMLANTWEIENGKKVYYQPPSPVTWFRAFDTLADGVSFHFNFLRNNRYKVAWSAVEAGNPSQFSKLLKQQGYYTADESAYTNLLVYYFNQFMNKKDFETALEELAKEQAPKPVEEVPAVIVLPEVEIVAEKKSWWQSIIEFIKKLFK